MQYRDAMFQPLANINRYFTMMRRRHSRVRHFFSPSAIRNINKCRFYLSKLRTIYVPIRSQSSNVNIFHCCVQKTGSQWIKSLLTDIMTYRYSGLIHYHYQAMMHGGTDQRMILERSFTEPFPVNTIISPLYIDYDNYARTPKSGPHKVFFVMRDPRDIIVSWYFSTRYSHVIMGSRMSHHRTELNNLSINDGLMYAIEYLHKNGRFTAMHSWASAGKNDPNVLLIRYEDISAQDGMALKKLFYDLDIRMPEPILEELIQAYSFKRLSGREQGKEKQSSHLRKGASGDWRNYFDSRIESRFYERCGDLHERLGYA